MTIKIVGIQGNHPSSLNPKSDTSIFLAIEAQNNKYKIFYYEPKDLSIINDKVIAKGYYIELKINKH
jgi:glutathione synthase